MGNSLLSGCRFTYRGTVSTKIAVSLLMRGPMLIPPLLRVFFKSTWALLKSTNNRGTQGLGSPSKDCTLPVVVTSVTRNAL